MWTVILCCGFVISGISANMMFYREGETATLECTGGGDVQYWFLHGKGSAIDNKNQNEGISLTDNGTLYFENVSKNKHEGSHICITKIEETYNAYSVDMKVRPLYPENLWKARYRGMFITGFIAALVCLTLFGGFCLVHRYRYREPLQKVPRTRLVEESYINPAMIEDENFSSKM